ncbi:microsomal glutathione S-transferase 1-like [Fopius arisanus]|uniref:Microsomal glutathione S-transferase 1 n=1 Tax=Fopius arisanus TaxID=64838 RepID=A0A9R1SU82_9HYME|nr:PREDICTED: microsomal glutathione S-transferase 1-like [Fopius arisanus]
MSINDENFRIFAYWSSILVLKVLGMVVVIGRWRWGKRIFISPEDTIFLKGSKIGENDPDVERARRAHLNDLENIFPWAVSTALWLTTSPSTWLAALLIKTFAISRIVHSIVYAVIVIPQPARFLAFGLGFGITVYQSVDTFLYYYYT